MKRLLACILGGIVTALILIQFYSLYLHPENNFYKRVLATSTQYEQKLRQNGHACHIFAGGSETRSSIIPSYMLEESGIPAVNTATSASYGLHSNTAIALNHIQKGDTLVLSVICVDNVGVHTTGSGIKITTHLYGTDAFTKGGIPFDFSSITTLVASDAASMITAVMRKITRGYAFIYEKMATIHPDGWQEIHSSKMHHLDFRKFITPDYELSAECMHLLQHAQNQCQKMGASFCVMLPAGYNNVYETKRRLMHALQITRMGIPVLRDERLGRVTDNKLFTDTYYHMNKEGAEQNTRIIGTLLKEKSYWSEAELLKLMQEKGYTEDSTPQI